MDGRCRNSRVLAVFALALLALPACAQDVLPQARALATGGRSGEALALLERRLAEAPGDVDARLLYGLVLCWEHRYGEARVPLREVLAGHPRYLDARIALVNLEIWSGNPAEAERVARAGLEDDPNQPALVVALARALRAQKRDGDAIQLLARARTTDSGNQEIADLLRGVRAENRHWLAMVDHSYEWFSDGQAGWHETQLTLTRATSAGSVVARFARADRFSLSGHQAELEFYPSFRRGTYAYLDAGYSFDATLYPRYRLGAELYQSLGHGMEASGGFRRLAFASKVNLYTGSLSRYQGNWLFTGRFYLVPNDIGASQSVYLITRRYFGDTGDYLGFRAGRGSTPSEIRGVLDIGLLNSTSAYAELYKSVGGRWLVWLQGGLSREDRPNRPTVNRYLVDCSLLMRF